MYRKALGLLILIQILLLAGYSVLFLSNKKEQPGVTTVYEIQLNEIILANEQSSVVEIGKRTSSKQRVVTYDELVRSIEEGRILLSDEDYNNLLRIVEAEASGEDEKGKILVANVVLNRVADDSFPDTVSEVIFQQNNGVTQFSPVANGRFYTVEISEETIEAVDKALAGEDLSQGALYFAARKHANKKSMRWFDECLEFLFAHGGHEFFAE